MNRYHLNVIPKHDPNILECFLAMGSLKLVDAITIFKLRLPYYDKVVLYGGNSIQLTAALRQSNFVQWADGKEIWAFSAGISALTCVSWNQDEDRIIYGLGLLPFKSIVHYDDRRDRQKLRGLKDTRPMDMPILLVDYNTIEMVV